MESKYTMWSVHEQEITRKCSSYLKVRIADYVRSKK